MFVCLAKICLPFYFCEVVFNNPLTPASAPRDNPRWFVHCHFEATRASQKQYRWQHEKHHWRFFFWGSCLIKCSIILSPLLPKNTNKFPSAIAIISELIALWPLRHDTNVNGTTQVHFIFGSAPPTIIRIGLFKYGRYDTHYTACLMKRVV